MEYTWVDFDLNKALNGSVVGIENGENSKNVTMTGKLQTTNNASKYRLILPGLELEVNSEGYITKWIPSKLVGGGWLTDKLRMPVTSMPKETAVGTIFTRPGDTSAGEPEEVEVDLTDMEPRDYFAVNALRAMLAQAKHPEQFDDATKLYYSRAAYKWAQAMITAAIDSRSEKDEPEPGEEVHINLTIVSNVQSYSTGEIKLYVDNHIGIWANLANANSGANVYAFSEGYSQTFSNILCKGNGATASDYLNKSFDGNPIVYAFDGEVHNSSMVTCTLSGEGGKFIDGGNYTITITGYNPNP